MKNKIRCRIVSMLLCFILTFVPAVSAAQQKSEDSRASELLASMSLEKKITQTFMMDFQTWNGRDMTVLPDDLSEIISRYDFGAVILFAKNIKTTGETLALTKALQASAVKGGGIPLIIATDQEGGSVYRLGSGSALPGNMALAASSKVRNAETAGNIIGSELAAVGINTTLAPDLDVNSNANNPVIGLRSFGDIPETVSKFGTAFIKGLADRNIVSCAKHFPGHGDTDIDSHYGLPLVEKSREELEAADLIPFKAAAEMGADMIMTAHILYPQLDSTKIYSAKTGMEENRPATMSKIIISDILKGELGFDGVVCTDAMNMAGVSASFDEIQAACEALAAGADMLCMPLSGVCSKADAYRIDALIKGISDAVESGKISRKRLDDAVLRILKLKEKRGILDYDETFLNDNTAAVIVGGVINRREERRMAAEAVTVIKNRNAVLPLKTDAETKLLMLCPYTNEGPGLLMGWNRAAAAGLIPEGAQVRLYRFSSSDYVVSGELFNALDWADSVIINSEISSASKMSYDSWLSAGVKNVTEYCREHGKISVVLSVDKPYDVQLYPDADGILAVYGCKGLSESADLVTEKGLTASSAAGGPNITAGVEVALGVYPASGSLPVDIPVFDAEKSVFTDDKAYERGWGIKYEALTDDPFGAAGRRLFVVPPFSEDLSVHIQIHEEVLNGLLLRRSLLKNKIFAAF